MILRILIFGEIAFVLARYVMFDMIHDRDTQILTSLVGLKYAFIFIASVSLEYFRPSDFWFSWRTSRYIGNVPYDRILRDDLDLQPRARHLTLNVLFAALIEILRVFRLFTLRPGHGWRIRSDPINTLRAASS